MTQTWKVQQVQPVTSFDVAGTYFLLSISLDRSIEYGIFGSQIFTNEKQESTVFSHLIG